MSDERKGKWTPPKIDYVENKTNQMEQMFTQRTKREDREFFIRSVIKDAPSQQKPEIDDMKKYVRDKAVELFELLIHFLNNHQAMSHEEGVQKTQDFITQIISEAKGRKK